MRRLAIPLLILLTGALPAQAAVEVTFHSPEAYADLSPWSPGSEADRVLAGLAAYLKRLGERHLAPGASLRIQVLDLDRAGALEPRRGGGWDVRVLRGVSWPRLKLHYTLEEAGRPVLDAAETVVDLNYLARINMHASDDELRYEKQMLDDWFRARFVERRPPRP